MFSPVATSQSLSPLRRLPEARVLLSGLKASEHSTPPGLLPNVPGPVPRPRWQTPIVRLSGVLRSKEFTVWTEGHGTAPRKASLALARGHVPQENHRFADFGGGAAGRASKLQRGRVPHKGQLAPANKARRSHGRAVRTEGHGNDKVTVPKRGGILPASYVQSLAFPPNSPRPRSCRPG